MIRIITFVTLLSSCTIGGTAVSTYYFGDKDVTTNYKQIEVYPKYLKVKSYCGLIVTNQKNQSDSIYESKFVYQTDSFPIIKNKISVLTSNVGLIPVGNILEFDTLILSSKYYRTYTCGNVQFEGFDSRPVLYLLESKYFNVEKISDSTLKFSYIKFGSPSILDHTFYRDIDTNVQIIDSGYCEVNTNYGFFIQKNISTRPNLLRPPGQQSDYVISYRPIYIRMK